MANRIEELKMDIAELEALERQAVRQKNKDILSIEIRKLISEIVNLEEQTKSQIPLAMSLPTNTLASTNKRYEIKLKNYAWDQSKKFVTFYVTLKNVQNIPTDNIHCKFTPKSLELIVRELDGKDYSLTINNLLKTINPEQSTWKIKTDMVIINTAKNDSENWSHVTAWEKKSSDATKLDTNVDKMDPSEGIMSLMKNMYEKGDDEMKRTIAKAWTESQAKHSPF